MKPTTLLLTLLLPSTLLPAAENQKFSIDRSDSSITIKFNDNELLTYQLQKPDNKKYPLDSACFFHPLRSPSGKILTDLANPDHPHHRGIFLGWVEMHGKKDADFWGWGEPAPIANRKIVNRSVDETSTTDASATFKVTNDWLAENEPILREQLQANFKTIGNSNILDLTYTLTPDADLTLARWAFSGFCIRMPKQGKLTIDAPQGAANLKPPIHTKPESDWPAAKWYGFTLTFDDNSSAGIAILNHPKNPPTLWHNHASIRMLNPAITAPSSVTIKANTPLILRYRVIAHDGPADPQALNKLSDEWAQ
jgi:hypothetical protein